jgi:hypothetical protein
LSNSAHFAPKKRRVVSHVNRDAATAIADIVSRFAGWRYALTMMTAKTARPCSDDDWHTMRHQCHDLRHQLAEAHTDLIASLAEAPANIRGHSRVVDIERALDGIEGMLDGIERSLLH